MTELPERWRPRDALLGLLFVLVGAMVTVYAYLAMRNEKPLMLWVMGWFVGPVLLLIGCNVLIRGLRGR